MFEIQTVPNVGNRIKILFFFKQNKLNYANKSAETALAIQKHLSYCDICVETIRLVIEKLSDFLSCSEAVGPISMQAVNISSYSSNSWSRSCYSSLDRAQRYSIN